VPHIRFIQLYVELLSGVFLDRGADFTVELNFLLQLCGICIRISRFVQVLRNIGEGAHERGHGLVKRNSQLLGLRQSIRIGSVTAEVMQVLFDLARRRNWLAMVCCYLLARAYHDDGDAKKAADTLEPIIKNDFSAVRSYIEYVRSMIDLSDPPKKCAATLSQCRLDGANDPAFIGLYGGLLYVSGNFEAAQKVWDEAKEQNFSYEERIKKQYQPREADGSPMRFRGTIKAVKPSYLFIQPTDGFEVISSTMGENGVPFKKGDRVEYNLTFSAKNPFAENLKLIA
jgi:hypothetical protein